MSTPFLPNMNQLAHDARVSRCNLSTIMKSQGLLVSIDSERYIHDGKFTEIGISILDLHYFPQDKLLDIPTLISAIKSRHIRFKDAGTRHNQPVGKFRPCENGCEDHLQFGKTEYLWEREMGKMFHEICNMQPDPSGSNDATAPRLVGVIFHGIGSDVEWLRKMGYDMLAQPHITIIDNQLLQERQANLNPIGLAKLLEKLGIRNDHHHNGGNDAVRTLASTLAVGVRLLEAGDHGAEVFDAPGIDTSVNISADGMQSMTRTSDDESSHSAPAMTSLGLMNTMTEIGQAVEKLRYATKGVYQFPHARVKGDAVYCLRCRSKTHILPNCEPRCNFCRRLGHLEKYCFKKVRAKVKGTSGGK